MFRAGLTGTNWTGKSETISQFVEDHPDESIEAVSLSAILSGCPFPTVANQSIEASAWMAGQVRAICTAAGGPIQLFDRTPVDILAFTLYVEERTGQAGGEVVDDVLSLLEYFDTIFHVTVPEAWPVGVSPSFEEVEFARLMDSHIRRAIDRFALEVTAMPWDFDARQRLLCEQIPAVGGDES